MSVESSVVFDTIDFHCVDKNSSNKNKDKNSLQKISHKGLKVNDDRFLLYVSGCIFCLWIVTKPIIRKLLSLEIFKGRGKVAMFVMHRTILGQWYPLISGHLGRTQIRLKPLNNRMRCVVAIIFKRFLSNPGLDKNGWPAVSVELPVINLDEYNSDHKRLESCGVNFKGSN